MTNWRHRTDNDSKNVASMSQIRTSDGVPYYTYEHRVAEKLFNIYDIVTPNFHKRSQAGEVIVSPCVMDGVSTFGEGGGTLQWIRNSDGQQVWSVEGNGSVTQWAAQRASYELFPKPNASSIDTEKLMTDAAQAATASINSTPFAFQEDLAELRQTIDFIKSPLKATRNLVLKIHRVAKRRSKLRGIPLAQALSSVWLENRFALMPLVRSISDALEAAETKFDKQIQPYYTARSKQSDSVSSSEEANKLGFVFEQTKTVEQWVSFGAYYRTTNPVDSLREGLGLRITDIPETIWAVFPLSFMVDRVANISRMLSGMRALTDPETQVFNGWQSVKTKTTTETRLVDAVAPGWTFNVDGDSVKYEHFSYSRSQWQPSFVDTIPSFDLEGLVEDVNSTIDLAALVIKLLVKRK